MENYGEILIYQTDDGLTKKESVGRLFRQWKKE